MELPATVDSIGSLAPSVLLAFENIFVFVMLPNFCHCDFFGDLCAFWVVAIDIFMSLLFVCITWAFLSGSQLFGQFQLFGQSGGVV